MYLTHTGLLFTAEPFHYLSLPLSIQPHSMALCAWWDTHATMVVHYGPWLIVLHLHEFCG